MCCGLFSNVQHVLRLLEIICCAVVFCLATYYGSLTHPYGIWCTFTWIFCLSVSLFILIMEVTKLKDLLAPCLPRWEDFTCGMTMLCSLMMLSASFIYTFKYTCLACIIAILCAAFSFAGLAVYVVDAVMAKLKCPSGYLSNIPGFLRAIEAFVANVILSSVASYFLEVNPEYRAPGMIWSSLVYSICFTVNVVIILLNLIKFLNILCCPLDKIELIFNAVSVVMYLSAAIAWPLYGYHYYKHYNEASWGYSPMVQVTAVTVMTIVNLILYIVDLVYSIIAVKGRI